MRLLFALVAASMTLLPAIALAQEQDCQITKLERSENFVLPYTASNRDEDSPFVCAFDEPKGPSWILLIRNNMSYVQSDDSKTIIRMQEPSPSEKYVELAMFGGESKRFWVAVNTQEAGYARIYDQDNGWTTEGPVSVTYSDNGGLTVSNGKRTVVDRLNLDGFSVGSVAVYGNDDEKTTANTYAGNVSFEILFGSFEQSSLYYVPLGVTLGVGGVIIGLLIFKKRKPD